VSETTLKYNSTLDNEGKMYKEARAFLVTENIVNPLLNRVILGLSEAFTNALVHGNRFDENKLIEIHLVVNNACVVADIIDEGEAGVDILKSRRRPGPDEEGGRGLDLIETLADRVLVRQNEGSPGMMIRLYFDREKYKSAYRQKNIKGAFDGNQ
jgi:anti-sigma regulatory factor (Ser/Thr protein kinase)